MSRRKSGKQTPLTDLYAAAYPNDHFGTVYESMLTSPAYLGLSIGAKHFYTLCRVQAQSEEGRRCLYQCVKEYDLTVDRGYFVFPSKHLQKFDIARSKASKWFKELEANGFIKCIQRGKNCFAVNIYRFSNEWIHKYDGQPHENDTS